MISASASVPASPEQVAERKVKEAESDALVQFLDDLSAANRFKTFLLGIGVELPADVLEGLAALTNRLAGMSEDRSGYGTAAQAAPALWTGDLSSASGNPDQPRPL